MFSTACSANIELRERDDFLESRSSIFVLPSQSACRGDFGSLRGQAGFTPSHRFCQPRLIHLPLQIGDNLSGHFDPALLFHNLSNLQAVSNMSGQLPASSVTESPLFLHFILEASPLSVCSHWTSEHITGSKPSALLEFRAWKPSSTTCRKAGFRKIWNLKGGILAWSDEVDPSVPKY